MKKFLPYIFLIVLILAGILSPSNKTDAQTKANGCYTGVARGDRLTNYTTQAACSAYFPDGYYWYENGTTVSSSGTTSPSGNTNPTQAQVNKLYLACVQGGKTQAECSATFPDTKYDANGNLKSSNEESAFEKNISDCRLLTGGFDACLVKLTYYVFYAIPSFLLNLVANFFNIIIPLALDSALYGADFILSTWSIVRDLSNVFFILILLYIAIELILGLSHDAKNAIVYVVIMAILINFSMFFTKVVIDSSNILALVFYNKINVNSEMLDASGKKTDRIYVPMLKNGNIDKDITGGLVYKFDPTKFLSEDFFKKARDKAQIVPTPLGAGASIGAGAVAGSFIPIVGTGVGAVVGGVAYFLSFLGTPDVPPSIMISLIISSGLIMIYAIYAFFIASISFLARLIELWGLIIFSPFAFMSFHAPLLGHVSYIGWEDWSKRLLKTSFMAPIFMFFMYVIFQIVNTNIWNSFAARNPSDQGLIEAMLFIFLPALIILALLQQATKFAKEASGKLGEMILSGAKLVGGLALGVAAGSAAFAGRTAIGGGLGGLANLAAKKIGPGKTADYLKGTSKFLQARNFDARSIPGAGKVLGMAGLASGAGMVGMTAKGGWAQMKKEQVEKRQKRAEELKEKGTASEKIAITDAEIKLKEALINKKPDLDKQDKKIEQARIDLNDAKNAGDLTAIADAQKALKAAKIEKAKLRGAEHVDEHGNNVGKVLGGIADLESQVSTAKHNLTLKEHKITNDYVTKITGEGYIKFFKFARLGAYNKGVAEEAARKIRSGAKIESSGGDKNHGGGGGGGHAPAPKPAPATHAPSGGGGHGGGGHGGGGGAHH